MGNEKGHFPLVAILLLFLMILPPDQASVSPNNTSWIPMQVPQVPGGTINQVIIDPFDTKHLFALQNNQTRFFGARFSLFESQDAAGSWHVVYTFEQGFIYFLLFDPGDPSILYASTSSAILRSDDNGRNWVKIADFGPVMAAPAADTLYAIEETFNSDDCGMNTYFARSYDRGKTWETFPLGCYSIMEISTTPEYPDWIYIRGSAMDHSQVIFRSMDAGATWDMIPLNGPFFQQGLFPLAVDPHQPKKLYTSSGSGVILSVDGGLTWSLVQEAASPGHFLFAFRDDVIYAALDPVASGKRTVIYRSTDGGEGWETLAGDLPERINAFLAVADQPEWLYAGLDGYGVYRSIDEGHSWQAQNDDLNSAAIIGKLAPSQSQANWAYALSWSPRPALFRTTDGAQTWSGPLLEIGLRDIAIRPDNPNDVWAIDSDGLIESQDGGESWQRVSGLQLNDLDVSPAAPDRPCAGGASPAGGFLFCRKEVNGSTAGEWELFPAPGSTSVYRLAISPTQANLIFAAGAYYTTYYGTTIFRSLDGGKSWSEAFPGPPPQEFFPYSLDSLAVSNGQPAEVIAVFGQPHPDNLLIFDSIDTGETWKDITHELEAAGGEMWTWWTYKAPVVIDPGGTAYFATRNIILARASVGRKWILIGDVNDAIRDMAIFPGSQPSLVVAAENNLWKLSLPYFKMLWLPMVSR